MHEQQQKRTTATTAVSQSDIYKGAGTFVSLDYCSLYTYNKSSINTATCTTDDYNHDYDYNKDTTTTTQQ